MNTDIIEYAFVAVFSALIVFGLMPLGLLMWGIVIYIWKKRDRVKR